MRILFVGLPGVGKTSVVEKIVTQEFFEILNIGDLMKQNCFEPHVLLGEEERIHAKRLNVSRYIGERNDFKLLVTGHGVVNFGEYDHIFGSSLRDIEIMRMSAVVILEARPEIIYNRRLRDIAIRSDRIIENQEIININQQNQKEYYTKVCKNIGMPCFIYDNSHSIDNVRNILETIDNFARKNEMPV